MNPGRGIERGLNFTGAAQSRAGADPVAGSTSHPDRNDVGLRWTLATIRRIPLFAVDVSDVARKVCDLLIAGEQFTNDTNPNRLVEVVADRVLLDSHLFLRLLSYSCTQFFKSSRRSVNL
jgi:hypothetical protein